MAVPPTSPLRVFPQAVNVDVQGFMPQGDLFQKTMGAFEQGSKLPLLQEQIKTEKMRNKLERDKLKLAEQTLVEDDARARAAADVEAKINLAKLAMLEQELEAQKRTVVLGGEPPKADAGVPTAVTGVKTSSTRGVPGVFSPMFRYKGSPLDKESVSAESPAVAAAVTPTKSTAPLAEQTLEAAAKVPATPPAEEASPIVFAPLSDEERKRGFGEGFSSEEIAVNDVRELINDAITTLPRNNRGIVVPSQNAVTRWVAPRVNIVPNLEAEKDALAEQMAYEAVGATPGQKVTADTASKFKIEKSKARRDLKTETGEIKFYDSDLGLPFKVQVDSIDGNFYNPDLAGMQIDVEELHKNESLKARDVEYGKSVADLYKNTDVAAANLANLDFAEELLAKASADKDGKFFGTISGPMVGLIPEAVRARVPGLQEGVAVQDAILQVVQQSLKATLGGQFAQKEAQELFKRAFDPRQPPAENLRRLQILKAQIVAAQEAGNFAADYFNANKTLSGFDLSPQKREAIVNRILQNFERAVDSQPEGSKAVSQSGNVSSAISAFSPVVVTDRMAGK